ncbi:hypothetical protein PAESOLCIP111_06710 [Paenibacillus solanacearum]|uniref:DUF2975 domain-containing protein n=1 Tax=Paenibacillus solanacearum TaxID=2048548 RepID=A0A916K8P5_9BACL|nr:hypothetical protein PAESOLCIP111_06710 [Paenibacillus solanacearum]
MIKDLIKKKIEGFSILQFAILLIVIAMFIYFAKLIMPDDYRSFINHVNSLAFMTRVQPWMQYVKSLSYFLYVLSGIMFVIFFIIITVYEFYWTRFGYNGDVHHIRLKVKDKAINYWMTIAFWSIASLFYLHIFEIKINLSSSNWLLKLTMFFSMLSLSMAGFIIFIQIMSVIFSRKTTRD